MYTGPESSALRSVVADYLEGMIYGDADQLRLAFHPSAVAAGHFEGRFYLSLRDAFIAEWLALATLPRGTPFVSQIEMIDVTGDVAVVKVTDTCFGDDYTDYLTLTKTEGAWRILSKAWFVHPAAGPAQ